MNKNEPLHMPALLPPFHSLRPSRQVFDANFPRPKAYKPTHCLHKWPQKYVAVCVCTRSNVHFARLFYCTVYVSSLHCCVPIPNVPPLAAIETAIRPADRAVKLFQCCITHCPQRDGICSDGREQKASDLTKDSFCPRRRLVQVMAAAAVVISIV